MLASCLRLKEVQLHLQATATICLKKPRKQASDRAKHACHEATRTQRKSVRGDESVCSMCRDLSCLIRQRV